MIAADAQSPDKLREVLEYVRGLKPGANQADQYLDERLGLIEATMSPIERTPFSEFFALGFEMGFQLGFACEVIRRNSDWRHVSSTEIYSKK